MANQELLPELNNFIIVGLGLIGGSIAKDVRSHYPEATISVVDPDVAQVEKAIADGNVNRSISIGDIGKVSCFVIIATPIDVVVPVAKEIALSIEKSEFSPGDKKWIVMDTASVKANIVSEFEALTSPRVEFVGTHPMAGTEYTSYAHSKKNLFKTKPWMVIRHEENTNDVIGVTESFIRKLGGLIREIDAESHDKTVALVSHSVIMLSNYIYDFISRSNPAGLEMAGDGFASTTRLASGNPKMHADILEANHAYTQDALEDFLEYLRIKIDEGVIAPEDFFQGNMLNRNKWLHKKR